MMSETERQKIDSCLANTDTVPISYYDSLLARYPNDPFLIGMKAIRLTYNDDTSGASNFLGGIPSNIKDNTYVLTAKGLLQYIMGKAEDALLYYQNALQEDVDNKNKWLRLELYKYYKKHDESLAWKYLEEAIDIDRDFTPALIAKSYELDQVENCEEIISLLGRVVKNYDDSDVNAYLGGAYYNCGNVETAQRYLTRSIDQSPTYDTYAVLGHISHYEFKDYAKALSYYKKSLALNANDPITLNDLGWLYYDLKIYLEAEHCFSRLVEADSTQEPFNQLISFYILMKQFDKADNARDRSIKINGQSYFTDGFHIIIEAAKTASWNEQLSDLVKFYEDKYTDIEINWLQETMSALEE